MTNKTNWHFNEASTDHMPLNCDHGQYNLLNLVYFETDLSPNIMKNISIKLHIVVFKFNAYHKSERLQHLLQTLLYQSTPSYLLI